MRPSLPKVLVFLLSAAVVSWMQPCARAQAAVPADASAQTAGAQTQTAQAQAAPAQAGQTQAATGTVGTEKAGAAADEGMTEEEVAQMLVGKLLFLRGGYLADRLSFDSSGNFTGSSPRGSYTLCGVKIEKVHLTKHKLELTGQRYGLHFLGVLASEGADKAYDAVDITPKKKDLEITIDRDSIEEPKAKKFGFLGLKQEAAAKPGTQAKPSAAGGQATSQTTSQAGSQAGSATPAASQAPQRVTTAATPETQEQADQALKTALGRIFSTGIDSRLIATMPAFWQLYYKAVETKTDFQPSDPTVETEDQVDQKPRLLTSLTPQSNEYAQAQGVSGIALYEVVVDADGRAGEIAVARPIGFGLDANAVAAIRKMSFQPAVKNGRAVPVLVDLVVEFRIYSDRTEAGKPGATEPAAQPAGPVLPGPYSVGHE